MPLGRWGWVRFGVVAPMASMRLGDPRHIERSCAGVPNAIRPHTSIWGLGLTVMRVWAQVEDLHVSYYGILVVISILCGAGRGLAETTRS